MHVFRTPDERFAGITDFPFAPNYLELSGDLDGLRMHYVEHGSGPVLLLLHGEPTWSYLYRKMIPPLSTGARVVVPDLVGFGRSDKPTDRAWYSFDRHVETIVQLIRHLDLSEITVVVQDWGGPIGLRAATQHSARFEHLVILNTGIFKPSASWPTEGFMQWRRFVERTPDLPIGFVLQGATSTHLPEEVIAAYEAPFPDSRSKAGAAAFPLLVPLDDGDAGAAEMAEVGAALERWHKPVLVAFSDSDPVFPQAAGRRMAERIPSAVFVGIEGASHFLQEDKGEEIAELIRDWLGI